MHLEKDFDDLTLLWFIETNQIKWNIYLGCKHLLSIGI